MRTRLLLSALLALITGPLLAQSPQAGETPEQLLAQGQAETLAETMEARISEDGADADARYWLARARLAQINDASVFRKLSLAKAARTQLETAIELDERHIGAHRALARYYLEAPAIAGGSEEKARELADDLLKLDRPTGYRVMADIARADGEPLRAVDYLAEALGADKEWRWTTQYELLIQAVSLQAPNAGALLTAAEDKVKAHADDPSALLPLIDYQRGKLSATSGDALAAGRDALLRYLEHTPEEGQPDWYWAEFRLAQIERQLGLLDASEARLDKLEAAEISRDLGYAIRDERRWHYGG